jgi:hypothetical protein
MMNALMLYLDAYRPMSERTSGLSLEPSAQT